MLKMKRGFLGLLLTVLCQLVFSQSKLTENERLYHTGKIWGFIKYYHPQVGSGSVKIDQHLFSLLKETDSLSTKEEFSAELVDWIGKLGNVPICKNCDQGSEKTLFLKNFDLSWTQTDWYSDQLKEVLKNIENNRFQGEHHYIDQGGVKQFKPKNEELYFDLDWQEKNNRLLILFRYWNYIEYFFPYKYQMDQNWGLSLKEMLPKFIDSSKEVDFHLAILELVVKIDDSHASYLSDELKSHPIFSYLSARFQLIEGQLVITGIRDSVNFKVDNHRIGDIINEINSHPVDEVLDAKRKYMWGSNKSSKFRLVDPMVLMGIEDSVDISIIRNEKTIKKTVGLYPYNSFRTPKENNSNWRMIDSSVAYLDLKNLEVSEVQQTFSKIKNAKTIIIDVRNYPKGTFWALSYFLKPTASEFAIFTIPDFTYPGKFIWNGVSYCGGKNRKYYRGKIILLANERTQSHAEFSCMCLQTASNVTTVGSQTSGADGNITRFPLFSRNQTVFTGIGVYYPDSTQTQRVGIKYDIEVKPTIKGIREGRDEVLEKAIEIATKE